MFYQNHSGSNQGLFPFLVLCSFIWDIETYYEEVCVKEETMGQSIFNFLKTTAATTITAIKDFYAT